MLEVLVSGLVTGWAIAVPVGAVGAYLVALTARTSWRTGAAGALGVAAVDGGYAASAVLAGAAVSAALAPATELLQLLAGVVLLAVATLTLRAALRGAGQPAGVPAEVPAAGRTTTMGPGRAFLVLVAITAVNPSTVVYFAAVVLGNRHLTEGAAEAAVFVAAAFVASASWQLTLAAGGALLGRVVTGPRGRLVTGVASAAVVAGLAIHTMSR